MTDPLHDTEAASPPEADPAELTRPGLHELTRADPPAAAERVAADLDADLVSDLDELRARLESAEHESAAGDGAGHVITDTDGLRALARRLLRSERILESTEAQMVETVGARVHGDSSSVALHPETIRSSAAQLLTARQELEKLEAELDRLDRRVEGPVAGPPDAAPPEERPETGDRTGARRTVVRVLVAAVVVTVVVGGVLIAVVGPLALVALAVPAAAAVWAVRFLRDADEDAGDRAAASANLVDVLAHTSQVYGDTMETLSPERGTVPASGGGRRRLTEGRIALTRERVRSAERAWVDLVGPDVDPDDVEAVLRVRDPQHFAVTELVGQTPQARVVASRHRRIRAEWRVAWAALGREAPDPAAAEEEILGLERDGITAVRADPGRSAATRRPLVVVDTGAVTDGEFGDGLSSLSATTPVIVVSAGPRARRRRGRRSS